jgi:hypothetical protein
MKFHLGSFLLGAAVGAGITGMAPRLRPLALELIAAVFQAVDHLTVRMARSREAVEDLIAEARARARATAAPATAANAAGAPHAATQAEA